MKKTLFILLLLSSCQVFEVKPELIEDDYQLKTIVFNNKQLSSYDAWLTVKHLTGEVYDIDIMHQSKALYSRTIDIRPSAGNKAIGKYEGKEVFWFDFETKKVRYIDDHLTANN